MVAVRRSLEATAMQDGGIWLHGSLAAWHERLSGARTWETGRWRDGCLDWSIACRSEAI